MTIRSLICVGICLALAACGGGGDGGNSDNSATTPSTGNGDNLTTPPDQGTNAPPPGQNIAISGKVIDGYLKGATVYLDLNLNRKLDDDEPRSVTTEAGNYRLELTLAQQECAEYVPLVVDVPSGAEDLEQGLVDQAYQMVLPPLAKPITTNHPYHVTPLTTALWRSMENALWASASNTRAAGGSLTCQSIKADPNTRDLLALALKDAIGRVGADYALNTDEAIFNDFIATGDQNALDSAHKIVTGLKQSSLKTKELKDQHSDALLVSADYHQFDLNDGGIKYPDAWYREQTVVSADKTVYELVKVSNDLTTDIRPIIHREKTNISDADYRYQLNIEYQSLDGDGSDYNCDIVEDISTTSAGKTYSLTNVANMTGPGFAQCTRANFLKEIKQRHAFVSYNTDSGTYGSQFTYTADTMPFLLDWKDLDESVGTLNMGELVSAMELLTYPFENRTSPTPEATFWIKNRTISTGGSSTNTSYSNTSQGNYIKYTTFTDNRPPVTECGPDDSIWTACQ